MAILVGKFYIFFLAVILTIYYIRHLIFTINRAFGRQRIFYHDIIDSELPYVSILIPMHNEENVAKDILDLLVNVDYPKEKLEIIPINDHSEDSTPEILETYTLMYPFIKPLHRNNGRRGKPSALNDAIKIAEGEIILVFDADYLPSKGIIRDLVVAFKNPEVGAVMGRVVPLNTDKNFLTRILDLERTAGYQVDQQARFNLRLIPQYGGTVGGVRKDLLEKYGYFDENILAEDTELTFRLYINGWKVAYSNRTECYEEVPEDWRIRGRQIRRWSRGHNQVMFKYIIPLIRSKNLNIWEKVDGVLLLCVYLIPFLLLLGIIDSLFLFFAGEMAIISSIFFFLFISSTNTFGNFAPFYQIVLASFLDGAIYRIRLIPLILFVFFFNMYYISLGFWDALTWLIFRRNITWEKTPRFRNGN